MPSAMEGCKKVDFNDLLQKTGLGTVTQTIEKKIEIKNMAELRNPNRLSESLEHMRSVNQREQSQTPSHVPKKEIER